MTTAPNARAHRRRVRCLAASIALAAGLAVVDGGVAVGGAAAPAGAPATESVVGLRYGSSGEAVRVLQRALIRVGVGVKYGVDGYFGSATRASVKAFQAYKGLGVTGVVDVATARALGLASAPAPTPSTGTLARGAVGDRVRQLQRSLVNAGIQVPGGVDGVFGSGTESAVRAYQRSRGLVANRAGRRGDARRARPRRACDRSGRARPRGDRQRRACAAAGTRERRDPGAWRGGRRLRTGDRERGEGLPALPRPRRHRTGGRGDTQRARPRRTGDDVCKSGPEAGPAEQRARPRVRVATRSGASSSR